MGGNVTAPAASAESVWINAGAVRGAKCEMDFQLLELSAHMSPLLEFSDVAKQVPRVLLYGTS